MSDLNKKYDLKMKAGKDFSIKENHWLPNKLGTDFFAEKVCKNFRTTSFFILYNSGNMEHFW
jgi:hypothetical protein